MLVLLIERRVQNLVKRAYTTLERPLTLFDFVQQLNAQILCLFTRCAGTWNLHYVETWWWGLVLGKILSKPVQVKLFLRLCLVVTKAEDVL